MRLSFAGFVSSTLIIRTARVGTCVISMSFGRAATAFAKRSGSLTFGRGRLAACARCAAVVSYALFEHRPPAAVLAVIRAVIVDRDRIEAPGRFE